MQAWTRQIWLSYLSHDFLPFTGFTWVLWCMTYVLCSWSDVLDFINRRQKFTRAEPVAASVSITVDACKCNVLCISESFRMPEWRCYNLLEVRELSDILLIVSDSFLMTWCFYDSTVLYVCASSVCTAPRHSSTQASYTLTSPVDISSYHSLPFNPAAMLFQSPRLLPCLLPPRLTQQMRSLLVNWKRFVNDFESPSLSWLTNATVAMNYWRRCHTNSRLQERCVMVEST